MNRVRCPLQEAAEISNTRPALVREGLVLTYGDYHALVGVVSNKLKDLGLGEGDRVGLLLQPDWNYPILLMALLRIGAVACPLDLRWPREQLLEALASIDCRTLISTLRDGVPEKEVRGLRVLHHEVLLKGEAGDLSKAMPIMMPITRPATILFTSGSSGRPKAVMHSYGNHHYSARGSNTNIRVGPNDRWLLNLPLCHVSGLSILFRCVQGGAAVVIPAPRESPGQSIAKYQATHLSLVGTQLRRLLGEDLGPDRIGQLGAVLVGGSAVSADLVRRARKAGYPVRTTYGLTEMASQVTTTGQIEPEAAWASSGKLLPHRHLKIGEGGEIMVRGQTLFLGYVDGGKVSPPRTAGGWFATGDMGELDGDGYLHVTGRKDNLYISGGENVYPEELEAALLEVEGVKRAVAVPVPDPQWGMSALVFVDTEAGMDEQALEAHLRTRLPAYKLPSAYHPWPEDEDADRAKVSRPWFARYAESLFFG
jgi:O-succinylbenzoic acid--CoA ligase